MSATYAHYRFGTAMLNQMPADLGCTAKRNRRLFDVGLHGPDLFFYYKPMLSTRINALGAKFHRQTGREFFTRVCRGLRLEPSDGGQAYLYGTLCHYALDSVSHPLIRQLSREGDPSHTRLETEFDRFLMELDGRDLSGGVSLTGHMNLTPAECRIAARFYPGCEGKHIRDSLKGMRNIRTVLEMPEGRLRQMVTKTMGVGSREFLDMLPQTQPEGRYRERNLQLLQRYEEASRRFPAMLLQLSAHLTYGAALGEEFAPVFG